MSETNQPNPRRTHRQMMDDFAKSRTLAYPSWNLMLMDLNAEQRNDVVVEMMRLACEDYESTIQSLRAELEKVKGENKDAYVIDYFNKRGFGMMQSFATKAKDKNDALDKFWNGRNKESIEVNNIRII